MRRHAWVLACLVGSVGCGSKAPTGIVVVVSAPDLVPTVVDRIEIDAGRVGGAATFQRSYAISADVVLPGTLTFVPRDGAGNEPIRLHLGGSMGVGGAEVVSRVARLGFVDGKTKLLRLTLDKACVGKVCTGDLTCVAGDCVAPDIDAAGLPDFVDRDDSLRPPPSATAGAAGAAGAAGRSGGGAGGAGAGGAGAGGAGAGAGGAGTGGAGNGGAGAGGAGTGGAGAGGAGSGGAGAGGAGTGGAGGAGTGGAGGGGAGTGGAGGGGAGTGGAPLYACSHAAAVQGPPLDGAKCDPCAELVCTTLPSCCTTAWDASCVSAAKTGCGSAAQAVTIADTMGSVKDVAVDGKDVFWITDRTGTSTALELVRASRDLLGGPTTTLDTAAGMFALALSTDEVFYRAAGEVRRVKKIGGAATPFGTVTGGLTFLAVGGGRLFWGDNVVRYDVLPGLAGPSKSIASTRVTLLSYEPASGYLYWTDRPTGGATNFLSRAKVPDGQVEKLLSFPMSTSSAANCVVATATDVYFADGLGGTVETCALSDCAGTRKALWASTGSNPQRTLLDGTRLYWSNHDVFPTPASGGVFSCDVSDCQGTLKSYAGQDKVQGLALDDLYVYWATQATTGGTTTGLIRRAPK